MDIYETINDRDIIAIVGPTASGKTSLSIELARKYNCTILNTDAFQIYREMNIGTAKASKDEMCGIKHHMIDIVNYDEKFDVSTFQKQARFIIDGEIAKGNKIILCGGSAMYTQSILYDYHFNTDENFDRVKIQMENLSIDELLDVIGDASKAINESDIKNHKRLVIYATKIKLKLSIEKNNQKKPFYENFALIGISLERELMYDKINKRVELMFDRGLVEEVRKFDKDNISQQAIGYKEVHMYINNELTLDETMELVKRNTRNFAKRQMTWYNKMNIIWK